MESRHLTRVDGINDDDNNEHRNLFNLRMFGTTFDDGKSPKVANRKFYTKEQYNETIRRLRLWDLDEHTDPVTRTYLSQTEFRKSCGKRFYRTARNSKVQQVTIDGQVVDQWLYLVGNKWKVVVHLEMVFDAIYECHSAVGHKRITATRNKASEKYYNLTGYMCEVFINTCPKCNRKLKTQPSSAPRIPGCGQFRDRFTACLVDCTDDPQDDVNGVTMHWILVLQDEVTKFTVLRPISSVDERSLAYELSYMIGMFGSPKLFTVDQAAALQSNLVKHIVATWNAFCKYKVRAIHPVVEVVKQAIADVMQEDSVFGGRCWVTVLPLAMARINKVSYLQVFGMEFSKDCISQGNEASGSEDELEDGGLKVGEIMQVDRNDTSHLEPVPEESTDPGVDFISIDQTLDDPACMVDDGDGKKYRVAYPRFTCKECAAFSICKERLLAVAEDKYYDCFTERKWWEVGMIATFATLKAHERHRKDMIFVDSFIPTKGDCREDIKSHDLPKSVRTILSVAFNEDHFVVIQIKLDDCVTVIHDGMKYSLDLWHEHEANILSQYGINKEAHLLSRFKESKDKEKKEWIFRHGKPNDFPYNLFVVVQQDTHNCGPIACMVLWKLLAPGEAECRWAASEVSQDNSSTRSRPQRMSPNPSDWRKMCIDELRRMLNLHSGYLFLVKQKKGVEMLSAKKNLSEEVGIEENDSDLLDWPSYAKKKNEGEGDNEESTTNKRKAFETPLEGKRRAVD